MTSRFGSGATAELSGGKPLRDPAQPVLCRPCPVPHRQTPPPPHCLNKDGGRRKRRRDREHGGRRILMGGFKGSAL